MFVDRALFVLALAIPGLLPACDGGDDTSPTGGTTTTEPAGGAGGEGGAATGGGGAGGGATTTTGPVDKAADCVDGEDDLGQSLTSDFGRLDGTVLAVVRPADTGCYLPNDDHVVVQVLWAGKAYRMVVNIESSFGDPDVFYLESTAVPPDLTWEEGWHTGLHLDYVADLGVKSTDFTQYPLLELADVITDAIPLGEKISVFAQSDGYPSSAHKIHRNNGLLDGAIVLAPGTPEARTLLFHFADQVF